MNTARSVQSFSDEHEAFAASRVSQYVFVPTKEAYFSILDQYADTVEGDVKKPLVLVGNEGSGKSALLANWVAKRREHKHRDEFLFQHFVGCSAQSLQLAHTLSRLESALAKFFHFNRMKVPDTEVELRWSLNRFLEAASKKHSPARIVIIIDGVHNLKSEGSPDGALYWLPTELPKCVRFIISTVEHDRNPKYRRESTPHHSFVELVRRQCIVERIVPLSVTTCHSVINAFRNLHSQSFELTESQQFKIVTANSSTQPMYLRSILQSVRLASSLTSTSADELLEKFLGCTNAHELVNLSLDICCQVPDRDEDDEQVLQDLLGKMMAMIYASRSGLTEQEIFGILRMAAGSEPTVDQKDRLLTILKDFTMVVNDMYAFSHEVYREVVYNKYIHNRGALVRWHHYLARFFDQLPTCPRKLVALPYHLEMAGSWSKVKNCLTDIEMFELWRTPEFRADFMKFWASLIKKTPPGGAAGGKGDTHDGASTHTNANTSASYNTAAGGAGGNRPSYDIVDEYCKSLDEWRHAKAPSDAKVRDIILQVATFLLDFAMLGHEVDAPALIHPKVPYEDLEAMGVPYIQIDENGSSVQRAPKRSCMTSSNEPENSPLSNTNGANNTLSTTGGITALEGDEDLFNDALGSKTMEDQTVTIYYYQRWMWIQFPYVALGNCDPHLFENVPIDRNARTSASQDDDHKGGAPMKRSETVGSLLTHSSTADEITKMVKRALGRSPVNQNSASASAADLKTATGVQREVDRERRLKELKKRGHRAKRTIPRMPPPQPPKAKVRGLSSTGNSAGGNGEGVDSNGNTMNNGNNDGNNGNSSNENKGEGDDNNATNKSMAASSSGPMLAGIGASGDSNGKKLSQLEIRILSLQDSIQISREEYDQLVQDRAIVERKLQTLKDTLVDLERTAQSCTVYDDSLHEAVQREQEAQIKLQRVQLWNMNLKSLSLMCDRHPANVPALITELQEKLELDGLLVSEFRKRLWEQRFEQQTYFSTFRHMKGLVTEAVNMRDQMLSIKEKWRDDLSQQAEEDERRILQSSSSGSLMSRQKSAGISGLNGLGGDEKGNMLHKDGRMSPSSSDKMKHLSPSEELQAYLLEKERESGGEAPTSLLAQGFPTYQKAWEKLSSATGITDPHAFCQRMENAEVLRQQIHQIKRASEQRLEMLRTEANEIEKELREAENSAKTLSIASTKDHAKLLASKQQELKQKREDVEGKDALAHRALSGLAQISDLLCLPKSDEDAKIGTIVSEIETALDTLLAEREKQQQQQQSTREGGSSSMPEVHASRSPELDLVLTKHETPTVRLPKKLPSRPESEDGKLKLKITSDVADQLHWNRAGKIPEEDDEDEADVNKKTWDRKAVKHASQTLVRTMMKSASRAVKSDT